MSTADKVIGIVVGAGSVPPRDARIRSPISAELKPWPIPAAPPT
jgi:hypothetical protein